MRMMKGRQKYIAGMSEQYIADCGSITVSTGANISPVKPKVVTDEDEDMKFKVQNKIPMLDVRAKCV